MTEIKGAVRIREGDREAHVLKKRWLRNLMLSGTARTASDLKCLFLQ